MKTNSHPIPVGTPCRASLTLPPALPNIATATGISTGSEPMPKGHSRAAARPYQPPVGTRCRASLTLAPSLLLLLLILTPSARAQWLDQTITLRPGWNAVYLHVDASHNPLDTLVGAAAGNKIKEIWLWQAPASSMQFTTSPQQPTAPNSLWAVWDSNLAVDDTLTRLIGNAAYLVNNTNTVNYTWPIKGKPIPPRYQWTTTGLNFIGFPTPAATSSTLDFDTFLAPVLDFRTSAEIYNYPGGALGANNPARVFSTLFRSTYVPRGTAFWIRSGTAYNRYYGPVEVNLQNSAGIAFADNLGTYSVRLKNVTSSSRTITLSLLASDSVPVTTPAQTPIVGTPPLLIRGALNLADLTYPSTTLSATTPATFTLAAMGQPGSELEVVLGLNRGLMTAAAGSLYAGVLRFTESTLEQVDVPVTATVASTAGLWVGGASVTSVNQYLKTYQRDANGAPVLAAVTADGAPYAATATNTAPGTVARPYPLRLILHNTSASAATLLQRVYFGQGLAAANVLATQEAFLEPALVGKALRISATHLPFSHANTVWPKTSGTLGSGSLVFNVTLDYNDHTSNPFLHRYHPDHDNLAADSTTLLVQGAESYRIERALTLTFTAAGTDFVSLTGASTTLGGTYTEVMTLKGTGSNSRSFTFGGTFTLNRISSIPTLTTQ